MILSSGAAVASITTATPSSSRSNTPGAQNEQLPDPMQALRSMKISMATPESCLTQITDNHVSYRYHLAALGEGGVLQDLTEDPSKNSAASLAATVLAEEAARQEAQERAREQIIFPDDLLPGVNEAPMTLREGLRIGGWWMFIILTAIVLLAELEEAAVYVLAPE